MSFSPKIRLLIFHFLKELHFIQAIKVRRKITPSNFHYHCLFYQFELFISVAHFLDSGIHFTGHLFSVVFILICSRIHFWKAIFLFPIHLFQCFSFFRVCVSSLSSTRAQIFSIPGKSFCSAFSARLARIAVRRWRSPLASAAKRPSKQASLRSKRWRPSCRRSAVNAALS